MCGIVGIISQNNIAPPVLQRMNHKLIHRGPDGQGELYLKNENIYFALAHRRLAIHDLTKAGQQPMNYLNRYWIVFNGEIYNYIELKNELITKGYTFRSHTDTEVIMAAYDYWGVDCLNKFNGDWAFVCIDTLKNKIFIARDRFGIKPLYYFNKPGLFIFASEIKAILEHPDVIKNPNLKYLKDYLKKGAQEYIQETAFENIFHFNFASYFYGNLLELLLPENMRPKIFWSLTPNLSQEPIEEKKLTQYTQKYRAILEDSIKLRLRADVKISANLSGGLDSCSILLLTKNLAKKPLETYSSVYRTEGTKNCDESEKINEITQLLNLKSHQIEPKASDIPSEHRKMIYYLDTPPDSTLMSSWYTAKLERDSNTIVTISGEGADEILAGYLRYITYYFANLSLKKIFSSYHLFKSTSNAKSYLWLGIFANITEKIIGKNLTQHLYELTGRKEKLFTPLNQKLAEDIFSCLVNLHHVDERAFMAHSIEHRTPFMDYRLIEFLAAIPAAYKIAKGWTKYLARYVFDKRLPDNIVWSKDKLGWPIPEKFWFEGELKNWLETTIQNSEFLKKHQLTSENTSLLQKIRLLNIAIWHDVFFN